MVVGSGRKRAPPWMNAPLPGAGAPPAAQITQHRRVSACRGRQGSQMKRYGYDHCRVCGKPIAPGNAEQLERWEEAQRRPVIPEKEWRRRGFLAAPTGHQLNLGPGGGCCADCGLKLTMKHSRYHLRGTFVIVGFIALMTFICAVLFYTRH
jgi:hypothetical protein